MLSIFPDPGKKTHEQTNQKMIAITTPNKENANTKTNWLIYLFDSQFFIFRQNHKTKWKIC